MGVILGAVSTDHTQAAAGAEKMVESGSKMGSEPHHSVDEDARLTYDHA
jgi:hypothetical protein